MLKFIDQLLSADRTPVGRFGKDENIVLRKGKCNFVFIHINKTAGSSISHHLGIPEVRHYTVKQAMEQVGSENWANVYSFTVVRHPWAKVLSQYLYRVKVNKNNLSDGHLSFHQWVEKVFGENPDPTYRDEVQMFETQASWLRDAYGQINITRIIRYERLNEEFSEVANIIGASPVLPRLNATSPVNYKDYYSPKAMKTVEQYFKEDIELWGWEY